MNERETWDQCKPTLRKCKVCFFEPERAIERRGSCACLFSIGAIVATIEAGVAFRFDM